MYEILIAVAIVAVLYWRLSRFLKKVSGVNVSFGDTVVNLSVSSSGKSDGAARASLIDAAKRR